MVFHNFPSTAVTGCTSNTQHVIGLNSYSSDYVQFVKFAGITLNNIANAAFMYIYDSPSTWASIDDCGEFPCTGPNNIAMHFGNIVCSGTNTPGFCTDHQGSDKGVSVVTKMRTGISTLADTSYAGCALETTWNTFLCTGSNWNKLGVLLFESLDSDTWDRSVQPVTIVKNEKDSTYANFLNSAMDHIWDGFYTGQTRLTRFPVQVENDKDYTVRFTGTPPGKMRFML